MSRWIALTAAAVALAAPRPALAANLLRNPGFEQADDAGTFPLYWTRHHLYKGRYTVKTDARFAHGGSVCVGVERAGPDAHKVLTALQYAGTRLRVAGDREYRLSVWARGSGRLDLLVYLYSQHAFEGSLAGRPIEADDRWQRHEFVFTAPETGSIKKGPVTQLTVAFHVRGGPVWLDDAALVPASEPRPTRRPAAADSERTPLATVPLTPTPPTLDGRLAPGEWDRAAAVTGFTELGGRLADRQTVVYLAFDERRLYVAFDSTYEGVLRQGEGGHDTTFGHDIDHVEWWVQPPGKGWFQFVGSPAGGILDNAEDGGRDWTGHWQFANHVESGELLVGGRWQAEVAVDFAELGATAPADGDVWRMNFCRDWSVTASQRRPMDWTSWSFTQGKFADASRFGYVRFRRDAPAVQLRSLGDLVSGNLDVRLRATATEPAQVAAAAVVTTDDQARKPILAREATLGPAPDAPAEAALAEVIRVAGRTPLRLGVTARVPGEDEPLAAADVRFECLTSLRLRLVPVFVRGYVDIEVDARRVPDLPAGMSATIAVTPATGVGPARTLPVPGLTAERPTGAVRLQTRELSPGEYTVKVTLADVDGRAAASTVQPMTVPARPAWLGNAIGKTDAVPPPWTPVAVEGNEVRVTQRTYRLSPAGLPAAIEALGQPLLAGPATLVVEVDGQPVRWRWQALAVEKRTARAVTWRLAGRAGPLRLEGTLGIEFDGFALWDVEVEATDDTPIDALRLEFPLDGDRARYVRANQGLPEARFCAARLDRPGPPKVTFSSGLWHYSPTGWAWPEAFFFDVWVGDESRGLSVLCETDEPLAGKRYVEFARDGETTTLRVHLLGERTRLAAPRRYRYAWQASPVKPQPRDAKRWRSCYTGSRVEPELLKRIYVGCSYHRLKWISYPVLRHPKITRRRTEAFHKHGAKIVPDFYLSAVSRDCPEFALYGREWEKLPRGGWSALTGNACYACTRSSYGDWIVDVVRRVVEECGLDGVYVDVSGPVACANAHHGCGYEPAEGGPRRPTMNLFAQREVFKRIYTYLHTGGRDGVIFSHTTHQAPIAGFLDVVTQGEEWGVERQRQYTRLTPGLYRAKEMKTQYGAPLTWYVFHHYAWRAKAYGTPVPLDEILMMCLPHRMLPTVNTPDIFPVWDLLDPWWTRAEFVGYWADPPPAETGSPDVLASAFVKREAGEALVVVSNWADEDRAVRVTLRLDGLGLAPDRVVVRDAFTGKAVPHDGATVPLDVPARRYRLLLVGEGTDAAR